MRNLTLLNKSKKLLFVFALVIFLFNINSFVFAQSNSNPLSACDLLKSKNKYKGKTVLIENFLDIGGETSTFKFEEGCSITEHIAVGTDTAFNDENFEKATDLLSLQSKGEKKLGFSLRWSAFLRVKIRAEGILKTSSKPKYGHLNSYKHLFLITDAEVVSESQLIFVQDWFKKDPKIIVTNDHQ